MPFRKKMKIVLGGFKYDGDDDKSGSPSSKTDTAPQRSDIEYYKIGEIPASKYKGPWDQKHQNKLRAFSFGEATHDHKDMPDSYSPHGTRAPSPSSSWTSSNLADPDSGTDPDEERGPDQGGERRGNVVQEGHERIAAISAAADAVRKVHISGPDTTGRKDKQSRTGAETTKDTPTRSDPAKERLPPEDLSKARTEDTIRPSA